MPPLDALNGSPLPLARLLGIVLRQADRDCVVAEMTVRDDLCTLGERVHGGALMALADTAAATGTAVSLPDGAAGTTTIESKTNFIAACALGETITTETTPLHRGRSTMVWQTRIIRADGRLAAIVTQTQLVLPGKRA